MLSFAEKVGWSGRRQDEAEFQKFCQETGISSRVLKAWMRNQRHNLKIKPSGSCTRKSPSRNRSNRLPKMSDEQDVGQGFDIAVKPSYFQVKKRFKTTLTRAQKNELLSFGEKVGWSIRGQEEAVVQQFCQEIGVERGVLDVWMYTNKHKLNKKINSSTPCTSESLSQDISHTLCSEPDETDGAGDLNVAIRAPHNQVRKRTNQCLGSSLNMASKCVSFGNVLPQAFHKGIAAMYLQEVNRVRCDDLDAPRFARVHSSDLVQECYIAYNLHQVETDYCDDLDAPPGFSRVHSSDPIQECYVAKNLHLVNTDYIDDLGGPPGFPRVHSSDPVQECYVAKNLHQVETDHCNDFASGFSRIVTGSAAEVKPIATLHVGMPPPLVDKVDTRPGISELIKRRQWDSLSEWSAPFSNTHPTRLQSSPPIPNQLSLSSERSKPVEDKWYFCRICNSPCPNMFSFMQPLQEKSMLLISKIS